MYTALHRTKLFTPLASRHQILEQECCSWKNHAANDNPLIFSYNLMVPTSSKKKKKWMNKVHEQNTRTNSMADANDIIDCFHQLRTFCCHMMGVVFNHLGRIGNGSTFHPLVTALYFGYRFFTRSIVTFITTVICFEIRLFTFLLIKQTQNQFIKSNVTRIIQLR